ncbi:MAG: ABC transporter permease [Rhodospirillales bacterium]|nr:ABC transporter permease [Rhodospirillales bacterium]
MRGGLRGFRILLACLALGVGTIAAVGSVRESVITGLRQDASLLLGGDVEIRLHNRPVAAEEAAFAAVGARAISDTLQVRAMARTREARSLVELKAVDGRYPLVGSVATEPAMSLEDALGQREGRWGALAERSLLTKLGIGIGDTVRLGEATFAVRGTIAREPDRVASVFSLGPRLLIRAEALPATGLVQPGSHIHYRTRVALAPGVDGGAWIEDLERAFPQAGWQIRTIDDAVPGVRRFIERMTLFLTFVGLTALLVGGIGVANAVGSYLDGKVATVATFKCLGAPSSLVFRTYIFQVMALALAGIAIGLVLGAFAPLAALWAIAELLPVAPRLGVFPAPLALAGLFGVLTSLTFAFWPLARARDVPAASLFRDQVAPARARPRNLDLGALAIGVVALAALTIATAVEKSFAYWFVGGAIVTLAVLRAGAAGLMAAVRRLPRLPTAELRLALGNIHRPGTATPSVVVSLGLGLSVLVAIALIEGNLDRQIQERLPEEAPAFFFIDIQPDQVDGFAHAVTGVPATRDLKRVPSLRGRIVAIAGVPVDEAAIDPDSQWAVRGDRALTYAAAVPEGAEIVAGAWWPADYRGAPTISLDAALARGFGVGLGDSLTFNILGREIEATVASLREIDWRSLRFDFAVIFAPGTLEGAPHTHIAAVRAPRAAEDALEKAVVDRFPNITAIRVREALEAAARILAGIGVAISATAALGIAAGVLVLAGAIAAGHRRRVYDAVVFKVLGATRTSVLKAFVAEFGLLGLGTGLVAAAVGTITAWAVVVFLMRAPWVFLPGVVAATTAVSVLLTMVAGFAGTWRALGQKAAPHLRNP